MLKSIVRIFALVLLMALCNCNSPEIQPEKTDNKSEISNYQESEETRSTLLINDNINLSILLDLSDRISPTIHPNATMEFHQIDIGYINSLAEAFELHIRKKKIHKIDDKIQLYFDPPPQNSQIDALAQKLKYHFTKKNVTKEGVMEISSRYREHTSKIYDLAIEDSNYVGSDVWRFFQDKVKDYCIEENYRNILVILTDGYIYHENTIMKDGNQSTYITPKYISANMLNDQNWKNKMEEQNYALIPATDDLNNLDVFVLGINPSKKNPYEGEVIKKYWSDWLTSMGVENFELKFSDLPSNMEDIISDFVQKK